MSGPPAARVAERGSGPVEGVLADAGVWEEVRRLARAVDARLEAAGARLTIGWEPTFVSASDRQSRHWWVEPLAPEKLVAARALGRALARRWAPGGVLVEARGKAYAGEAEPRWTLACVWRRDGVALRRGRTAHGAHGAHGGHVAHAGHGVARDAAAPDPRRFLGTLADRLGLPRYHVIPLFEADAGATGAPAGFVLPLGGGEPWRSEAWRLPEGPLTLQPGAAPAGFRLPRGRIAATGHRLVRGVAAEVFGGRLRVCLPRTRDPRRWFALVVAVELTASELAMPVTLAGHAPRAGPLAGRFDVAPDPGVLEVNMPPAATWDEWEARVTDLYEAAAEAGLDTRRFLLDGRAVGTGGGGHLLLGGASPGDSPFRRRPGVLARMLAYWHDHPALSYAFAGAGIGPYSQHPRADEGRRGAVAELEVALAELIAGRTEPHAALRHVLVDPAGNAHRAEFCIDKLGPPMRKGGLGGLLELRAFDTQPTARLSLLVHLLVRALFAWLWRAPRPARLERWGARLHDAFMLPEVLRADLDAVLADLAAAGLHFDPAWFEPLWEARFPVLGRAGAEGVGLELRAALEPWIALGEVAASRLVDSSIERLQVRLVGPRAPACTVRCNGHPLALRGLDQAGRDRGLGVRYRAWEPFDGLHPGIAPHAPLAFEVIEADGGPPLVHCHYHTRAPDGVDYPCYPPDAEEAARRRAARFTRAPQRDPDDVARTARPLPTAPEHPFTADLCRAALERMER
ncbi:MAG TPA: transglutaminase family protein [Thermohalobaculum sp.]|nr:transglutaminase family protein [Thermohalobaculum sp.]